MAKGILGKKIGMTQILEADGRQVTDIVLDFCGVFIIWLCREIWLWSKK